MEETGYRWRNTSDISLKYHKKKGDLEYSKMMSFFLRQ